MELTWWAVAIVGLGALVAGGARWRCCFRRSRPAGRRPLANTTRLTRLPEYRAVVRRQTRATAAALGLLTLLFGATVLASARPSGTLWEADGSTPRDDIMLCIGEPVTNRRPASS